MDISLGPTFPDSVQVTPHPPNTSQPKDILWDCYSRIFKRMSFLTARTPATKHLYRTSACATMQSTILIRFFCLSIHLCNTIHTGPMQYCGETVVHIWWGCHSNWRAPWKNRTSWYISFFRPSLNGVLFPMFCLLVEGEGQMLVFKILLVKY